MAVMCPSHFCRVRVTSPSSQSRVIQNFLESSHRNCRVTSRNWFASSSQCRVTWKFTVFLWHFFMLWNGAQHAMAPDKFENGDQHAGSR